MSQTVFINVTVDGKSTKAEADKHGHQAARGSSASSDLTVSFDPTKVSTISRLHFALQVAEREIAAGKELTP